MFVGMQKNDSLTSGGGAACSKRDEIFYELSDPRKDQVY
jgi:hypothetical protein